MPRRTQRGASSGSDVPSTWEREGTPSARPTPVWDTAAVAASLARRKEGHAKLAAHLGHAEPAAPAHTGEDAWKGHESIKSDWKFSRKGQPQQLPMFMSAGEIMNNYAPLEGDKQSAYDPREGELTNRSRMTPDSAGGRGVPNRKITTRDRQPGGWMEHRYEASDLAGATHYRDYSPIETDKQLWSRKLEESQMQPEEYREHHAGGMASNRTPGYMTLAERESAPSGGLYQSGHTGTFEDKEQDVMDYVNRKIDEHYQNAGNVGSLHEQLSHAMRPGGEGFHTGHIHLGTQFGMAGKPEVVGGHHRVAAMADIDKDRLLPVLHHKNIQEAKQGFAGQRYT